MKQAPIEVFLSQFEPDQYGYDLRVEDDAASVADFLTALDAFADRHLADCRGCDGCCWERAPLTAPDLPALAALLPATPYPAQAVCRAFATVSFDETGIIDIILKRGANSACNFLDQTGKYCREWAARPFVCRSHFCLPQSARLQALRQEVVNRGENELARLLLAEEAAGAPAWIGGRLNPADFPADPAFHELDWRRIPMRALVPDPLWRELTAE